MSCKGLHCPGCGDGGGLAAIVLAVVIVAALIARPVIAAADAVLRVVIDVLEVTAIILASAAGLALIVTVAVAACRIRAGRPARLRVVSWAIRPAQPLTAPRTPVEAPRPVITAATEDEPASAPADSAARL